MEKMRLPPKPGVERFNTEEFRSATAVIRARLAISLWLSSLQEHVVSSLGVGNPQHRLGRGGQLHSQHLRCVRLEGSRKARHRVGRRGQLLVHLLHKEVRRRC